MKSLAEDIVGAPAGIIRMIKLNNNIGGTHTACFLTEVAASRRSSGHTGFDRMVAASGASVLFGNRLGPPGFDRMVAARRFCINDESIFCTVGISIALGIGLGSVLSLVLVDPGERKVVDDIGIELSMGLELVLGDPRREPTAPLPSRNRGS